MNFPNDSDPVWVKLFSAQKTVLLKFLGTKLLLSRLQLDYKKNPNSLSTCIKELQTFLTKNQSVPKVQEDIKELFK